jgi:hypothetical protein
MIEIYKSDIQLTSYDELLCNKLALSELEDAALCYRFKLDENGILKFVDTLNREIIFNIDSMLHYHKVYFYKNSVYDQPLAKALGIKKGSIRPSVIDATAGSLKDSMLIYSFGVVKLTMYERNPLVAVLISNSLAHADALENIQFLFTESSSIQNSESVIYFDPMYEEKNSKAAPRKEMQVFRKFVGADLDAMKTAQNLLEKTKRLVIKRSIKAKPLLESPDITFGKKSTQYDVYFNHS